MAPWPREISQTPFLLIAFLPSLSLLLYGVLFSYFAILWLGYFCDPGHPSHLKWGPSSHFLCFSFLNFLTYFLLMVLPLIPTLTPATRMLTNTWHLQDAASDRYAPLASDPRFLHDIRLSCVCALVKVA